MYFHLPRTCGSGSPLGGRTQAVSWALGEGGRGHLLLFSGALRCQGGWGSDHKPDAWSRPWAWLFLVFIVKLGKDACGPSGPQGDSLQRDKLGGPSKASFSSLNSLENMQLMLGRGALGFICC